MRPLSETISLVLAGLALAFLLIASASSWMNYRQNHKPFPAEIGGR